MEHLLIALLMIERNDWDTVVNLVGERVDRVVDDDHVFHRSIGDDSQILDVVALWSLHAVLPVHPILEQLILWVNVIEDSISVDLVRRSEDDNLEHFIGLLEALHEVRTQIDASTDGLLTWEVDLKEDIWVLSFNIIDTVDEGLVHIKDQYFLLRVWDPRFRKVDKFVPNSLLRYHCHIILDKVQGLQSVLEMLAM